ncbi:transcription repressor OFP13-like [Durio zibethinus]|uniref:Transcription repressor n=1 Tax=Durio zibethinus TaxID=66656 RepID=A0A6P5YX89_DURZI|nr:transcription repressor OFP13-like [Durio zibethinus]
MGKKMKPPFLSNSKNNSVQAKSSWLWPSCHQPRTRSFRTDDSLIKTINSTYLDAIIEAETPDPWFSNSSESASFSTASDESGGDPVETVIRGLRSERLFFEPGETSSILKEAKPSDGLPFKDSVILSMESEDPHVDFRKSMEEMVEAHRLKDWEGLEELLFWYLIANGKGNHGYIVGAFVDLLVGLAISSTCTLPSCSNCTHSPSSPLSFYASSSSSSADSSTTTPCLSSLGADEVIDNSHCLSSLSQAYQKEIIEDNKDDPSSALLDV